jgi:CRP-like cAMP-binding protein
VKGAAAKALGLFGTVEAIGPLLQLVPNADKELRSVVREALVDIGEPGWDGALAGARSADPFVWALSVGALARMLPEARVRSELTELCEARLSAASEERLLPAALAATGEAELAELAAQRCAEIERALADGTWAVLARLTDERVIASLQETIRDENEEVRENGLEVLAEGLGDRRVSGALLELHRRTWSGAAQELQDRSPDDIVRQAVNWADPWLRRMADYTMAKGERAMAEERKFLSMMEKVVFLKQVSLFSGLSVDELGLLAGIAQEEVFAEDAVIVRRGESNASLYLILEGNVELSSEEATIGVLGPKQSFGETSALDGSPSSVTAQAFFGDARTLTLQGDSVTRLIRLYPEIGIGLLLASSARVRLLETMLLKMG